MLLKSPRSLHYPITVTKLLKRPHDNVDRAAPLFAYYYKSTVTEGDRYGEEAEVIKTFPTHFESETDGTVVRWMIADGQIIQGAGVDLVEIEEPCRHDVQFGGMCANCGKDMTEVDYNTSKADTTRANINVAHGTTALKISTEEATRLEDDAKRRLLKSKKLSLVVDLDLTIIQATVDPTVPDWQSDRNSPNWEALQNVRQFELAEHDGGRIGRKTWYYIKLRPGLAEFLENMSKIYELHIYTMGTRGYAMQIAKIVDPDRRYFGDRILSRTENGSMKEKNLRRLFPVDTKMVVIIDDRIDVWNWSSNLIKVKPYDFFVGIGDINSSFLPRTEPLPSPPALLDSIRISSDGSNLTTPTTADFIEEEGQISALERLLNEDGNVANLQEQTTEQDEALNAQVMDRPLLQQQRRIEQAEAEANEREQSYPENGQSFGTIIQELPRPRHNLLQDDDAELSRLGEILRQIHQNFFDAYDRNLAGSQGGRVAELRGEKMGKKKPDEDLTLVPDVKDVMSGMKRDVLARVVFTISGLVPLGTDVLQNDLTRWATTFGAHYKENLEQDSTHLIADPEKRTAKVRKAAQHSRIKIVNAAWLYNSVNQWRMLDETPYIIPFTADTIEDRLDHDNAGLEELLEGTLFAAEEDEADVPTTDLRLNTIGLENAAAQDTLDSAVADFTHDDWEDMRAEFEDLSSDSEDGKSTDGESAIANASQESKNDSKKRKRETTSATATDGEESDAGQEVISGSALQRRKKKALARTTSLNAVATLRHELTVQPKAEISGNIQGAAVDDVKHHANGLDKPGNDDELELDLEAEFEKELLAQDSDEEKSEM